MRLIFYIFFFSQIFNFLGVIAEKVNQDPLKLNRVDWEKVPKKKSIPLKKIIWKSYNNEEILFEKVNVNEASKTKIDPLNKERINEPKKSAFFLTEIEPFLPLNNFLEYGNFQTSVKWKSSFQGGEAGGTGQQNPSFAFDYGLSDNDLLTIYFSEADDNLYNIIEGQKVNYHWQNYAFSFKKELLNDNENSFAISIVPTLEYWRQTSGSKDWIFILTNIKKIK